LACSTMSAELDEKAPTVVSICASAIRMPLP
jgi:hypothetical protein